MRIIKTISEMKSWSRDYHCKNPEKKIGLVPTMGFLHRGHLSLIQKINDMCDVTVVSIFVNPIQFNNPEDLKKYPRDLERDILLLNGTHADVLFSPDIDDVYPNGRPDIFIDYPDLTNKLCGISRPGHFSGMLTIVHNLFQWVKPDFAIFGLKDYQQYLLINKMSRDLAMPVEIIAGELIRDPDGLAMSSRNARLSHDERNQALAISHTLFKVKEAYQSKKRNVSELQKILTGGLQSLKMDYASLYNPETLEQLGDHDDPDNALVAVAADVGNVRLIDNILLNQPQA